MSSATTNLITPVKEMVTRAPSPRPEPGAEPTVVRVAEPGPETVWRGDVAPAVSARPRATEPTITDPAAVPANYTLEFHTFNRPSPGLQISIAPEPPMGRQLLTRLAFLFDDLAEVTAARQRADAVIDRIGDEVAAGVGPKVAAEEAALRAAEERLATAQKELEPLTAKVAKLEADYARVLAAGESPVKLAGPLATARAETAAGLEWVAKLTAVRDAARTALILAEDRVSEGRWKIFARAERSRLADRRRELEIKARECVQELTRELLEVHITERLIDETLDRGTGGPIDIEDDLLAGSIVGRRLRSRRVTA